MDTQQTQDMSHAAACPPLSAGLGVVSTGIYWNPNKHQQEAWVVNQDTGEKHLIGGFDGKNTNSDYWRWWSKEVWSRWLGLSPNVKVRGSPLLGDPASP